MVNKVKKFLFLLLFSSLLGTVAQVQTASWPEVHFIEDAKVNVVSSEFLFNGVPMKTWVMNTSKNLADVAIFYRTLWKPINDSLYDEQTIDGDLYINSKQGDFLLTVKARRELGQTTAFIGVSNYGDRIKNFVAGAGFPRLQGSNFINDIVEYDVFKKQRFLLLVVNRTAFDAYQFYLKSYRAKGWEVQQSVFDENGEGGVLSMKKDKEDLNITINRENGKTIISASHVTKTKS